MNLLTNALYLISTALLIPVIVILLFVFLRSLLMLGGFYGLYINRLKYKKNIKTVLDQAKTKDIKKMNFKKHITGNILFLEHINLIGEINWHPIHSEKYISDFEIKAEKELEASKTLVRLGPMLGLMGTLIPMGPALAGLASGDIASMAENMSIAFSTTVIGVFIGAIGFITQLVKQRWFTEDLNNLEYFFELSKTGDKK